MYAAFKYLSYILKVNDKILLQADQGGPTQQEGDGKSDFRSRDLLKAACY